LSVREKRVDHTVRKKLKETSVIDKIVCICCM